MHKRKLDRDPTDGDTGNHDVAANAARSDDLDACASLFEWVRSNGGVTAPVAVASQDGLRALVATRDIARGSHAIDVPASLLLTLGTAMKSRAGLALAPIADRLHPRSILATHLILSRRDRTFPYRYVDTLPSSQDDHPVLCSEELFRALAGTSAGTIAAQIKATIQADHQQISNCLPMKDMVDLEEFRWAFCNVLSRTFNVKLGTGEFQLVMTPVVDLLNHSDRPNCLMVTSADRIHVEALHDIKRGDELTISYGELPNIALLAIWGFCLERNSRNQVLLAVPTVTEELVRFSLSSERTGDSFRFWSGSIAPRYVSLETQKLFAFLRSRQSLPFKDQWSTETRMDAYSQPISRQQEIGVLHDFLAACNAKADSIRKHALASDSAMQIHPLARAAALAARGELDVLSHFTHLAEHAIETLEIDDVESARVSLSGIADEGYADALRASWETLWPSHTSLPKKA